MVLHLAYMKGRVLYWRKEGVVVPSDWHRCPAHDKETH